MKKNLWAAAFLSAVGTSAIAQSAFEGVYGQVGIGYENISASFTGGTLTTANGSASYTTNANNNNSFTGVVSLGAYFPVTQSFLLGLGAEYSPIESSSSNYTFSVPSNSYSETGSIKKQNSYNIFLSPAYAIDKDKLAYLKAGFTGASVKSTAQDGATATTNYTGYSLGLGYKQIISGGLYGFGEVNYYSYGSQNDTSDSSATLSGTNKANSTNVLVGLGYKF